MIKHINDGSIRIEFEHANSSGLRANGPTGVGRKFGFVVVLLSKPEQSFADRWD